MLKKATSMFLAATIVACVGSFNVCATSAEKSTAVAVEKGKLLYETYAVTQEDIDSNFLNYAAPDATTSRVTQLSRTITEEVANVVGIILDNETEEPVSGATLCVDETVIVTDEKGRFRIGGFARGVYDWEVSAEGYYDANYLNYSVDPADGTTIFTFYISKSFEINQDREVVTSHDERQSMPPNSVDMGKFATAGAERAMSAVPNVSDTVSVYYNGSTRFVDRETYIYTVLSSELYESSYYINKGLTETEIWQLYCAQAIAANTFLEYAMSVYSNHGSYDVCAGACCQVYDPTKVTEAAITAASNIFYTVSGSPATVIVFHEPASSTYNYIWGAFFSSCGGQGTKTHSTQPALQAVSCSDLATGAGGHRYGLCQMGAAKLAYDGFNAVQILLYYYTDCDTEFCMLT